MSRLSNTLTKHRKDNYSLDIKGMHKQPLVQTPFAKKSHNEERLFARLRTQVTHNSSMQASDKDIGMRQRRRLSLTKTHKLNNSVGVESHLSRQKMKRVHQLIDEHRYEECLSLLRQLIMKEENTFLKIRLFWLNAQCLFHVGKYKEAEHFLTRLLNQQPDNYHALVHRARVRQALGAKEMGIRDLKNAMQAQPDNVEAYEELCSIYLEEGNIKEALGLSFSSIQGGYESTSLLLVAVELIIAHPNLLSSPQEKMERIVEKARSRLGIESKDSADLLYLEAMLLESKKKLNEAIIYYEECLKFNNSKQSVTKSLQRLILIKIEQRDYYSAYHTVNRYRYLQVHSRLIHPYLLFLEGVTLIMKKKYEEGHKLFDGLIEVIETGQASLRTQALLDSQIRQSFKGTSKLAENLSYLRIHHKCKMVVFPMLLKFNAYAFFKLGRHDRAIHYYEKLSSWGMDECSSYNMLLAEGILAVEKKKNFQLGMEKFEQASYVYPKKVEPNIYMAMTVIYRDLCLTQRHEQDKLDTETLNSAVMHAMEELNEAHESINDGSSNLLYHRCILSLYLEDWESALADINLCIEKAEENEPKYFYLRGLCYAAIKQFRKAINEYSISLSLNAEFIQSLLERAKCYFLMGETESGFGDLKQYMYKNPNDHSVHKWIGDLLYEGKSYNDAYKAYEEVEEGTRLEVEVMKCKCLVRVADLGRVSECLTKMAKLENCQQNKIQVDHLAVSLLKTLTKPHQNKDIVSKISKLNAYLEQNKTGYVFELIDCMNLLGVATFDAARYEQAYESFLLVLELFSTLTAKNKSELKSDCSEEGLSLSLQDIYLSIIYCLLGVKDYASAARMMGEELLATTLGNMSMQISIANILEQYGLDDKGYETYALEGETLKNSKIKLRTVDLKMKNCRVKCFPTFSLFHSSAEELFSRSIAKNLVLDLKPSYIDNMPEGPWIKRNEHGVIFTDQIIEDDGSSTFLSSMRAKESQEVSEQNSQRQEPESEQLRISDFKKKMKLDSSLEDKLNRIIQKAQLQV